MVGRLEVGQGRSEKGGKKKGHRARASKGRDGREPANGRRGPCCDSCLFIGIALVIVLLLVIAIELGTRKPWSLRSLGWESQEGTSRMA
jgi:hypothetical protein